MNNILVTGCTGFIGSYIVDSLKQKHNCLGISRSCGVDIGKYSDLENLDFDSDIIIHTAAYLGNDFEESFLTNVVGTFNICKYAKEKKVKHIILISSISIFNNIENGYYNNYAKSKKQAEEVAQSFCHENGIYLTILRLSQVYDTKRMAQKSQGMLYFFIDSIQNNKKISIYGTKNPLRNYIHINDVLKTVEDTLNNQLTGTYNVINPKSHTVTELAYMIFELLDIKPNIEHPTDTPDILSVYIPCENLFHTENKFIELRSGIMEILSYEK